jgi:Set1/Ash2 histone methyltransferase complex subunit ASH2
MEKKKANKMQRSKSPQKGMAIEQPLQKRVQLFADPKIECLKISQDSLSVTGAKGYRSITANYPIIEGTYFFEVKIEKSNSSVPYSGISPQVRIGVATMKFDKEISLGSDQNSYAYKSLDGSRVHEGIKSDYGERFNEGDIIGCLIHMKPPKPKVKNQEPGKSIGINEGSFLMYFKNGRPQGKAFVNLKEGFYYAGVSLYMGAKAKLNFGPEFEKAIELDSPLTVNPDEVKPYSEIPNEPQLYQDIELP